MSEMILNNLPILQVIIPLIAAPICALLPRIGRPWIFTTIIIYLSAIISVLILTQVSKHGSITNNLGGWSAPIGIEYRVDLLSAMFLILTCFLGMVSIIYAKGSVDFEINRASKSKFYGVFLLCFAGMLGIIVTNDVFNLYVFLEISSLSSYALVCMGNHKRAKLAAFEYLMFGTVGATFILIGIGLLYSMTGTLNMTDLAMRIAPISDSIVIKAGISFIIVGIFTKIAIFPVHIWLPNVYQYSPTFITVFFSSAVSKLGIYMLLRFMFSVFNYGYLTEFVVDEALVFFGSATIIFGSMAAIYQDNIKRLLAFSSVAQLGYIIIALSIGTKEALAASIIYCINHAIIKAGLFMSVGAIVMRTSTESIDNLRGVALKMPWTAAALAINGASLVGVPLTAGFVSKWVVLSAILDNNLWLVIIFAFGAFLGFMYIFKIIDSIYFKKKTNIKIKNYKMPISMGVAIWLLTLTNIFLGINTEFNYSIANDIGNYLFGK